MASNPKPIIWDTTGVDLKAWRISGTDITGPNKQNLKVRRTELNLEAGVVEKDVPAREWPFKITKGSGHPNYVPKYQH